MLKNYMAIVVAVAAVSACSSPPPPSSSVAAATPQAPVVPVSSVSSVDSSGKAKTCSIEGLHWQYYDAQINPTMTVSNDGFCGTAIHLQSFTGAIMQLSSKPNHGTISTFGEDTSRAGFRYYPDKGYVGPDAFVMLTGSAHHEVVANFAVTVSQ